MDDDKENSDVDLWVDPIILQLAAHGQIIEQAADLLIHGA
jgi:hypothetical protein